MDSLLQGIKNILTICQLYVIGAVQGIPRDVHVVHYMDDIMIAHPSLPDLERVSSQVLLNLEKLNLNFASEKIQIVPPYAFLAFLLWTRLSTWPSPL